MHCKLLVYYICLEVTKLCMLIVSTGVILIVDR